MHVTKAQLNEAAGFLLEDDNIHYFIQLIDYRTSSYWESPACSEHSVLHLTVDLWRLMTPAVVNRHQNNHEAGILLQVEPFDAMVVELADYLRQN